jgi:hypothetical protein
MFPYTWEGVPNELLAIDFLNRYRDYLGLKI